MARPIPLASPGGVVYTYACGVCHRVCAGVERISPREGDEPPTGPDDDRDAGQLSLAEMHRNQADDCCKCRTCGKVGLGILVLCAACRAVADAELAATQPQRDAEAAREAEVFEAAIAKSLDRDAALRLLELLHDVSDAYGCSRWDQHAIDSAERAVRGELVLQVDSDLAAAINPDLAELARLSAKAGGWWRRIEGVSRAVFVPWAPPSGTDPAAAGR